MRRNIVHSGAGSLTYAIREIVQVAYKFRDLGMKMTWENIGDPIQKGEKIEPWIRQIMHEVVDDDKSWGYCDTAGVPATRAFLAEHVNKRGGAQVTADDILFFNGIGDAVAKVYGFLRREARVIGPTPAYSTHSSAEAAHSGYEHLTYELDPYNNWMPDLDDLRLRVKYNPSITAILLINPDNPTGAVYPREVLEEMAEIARHYNLFLIADEIYTHIVYNGNKTLHLSEVVGDVPAIVMRGISKEVPWPGARCSTTAPQICVPRILGDARFPGHLAKRAAMFEARAHEAHAALQGIPGTLINCPSGAFYMTIMFEDGILNDKQSLTIENPQVRETVEKLVQGVSNDYRFVYYLLGATGICVVPLTGFCCKRDGFRVTLLETDDEKRRWTFQTLAKALKEYLWK
jgi:alanine-synthesizing transaminase